MLPLLCQKELAKKNAHVMAILPRRTNRQGIRWRKRRVQSSSLVKFIAIQTVLTRKNTITGVEYRNDPTILGWELINEPRCMTDPSGDTLQMDDTRTNFTQLRKKRPYADKRARILDKAFQRGSNRSERYGHYSEEYFQKAKAASLESNYGATSIRTKTSYATHVRTTPPNKRPAKCVRNTFSKSHKINGIRATFSLKPPYCRNQRNFFPHFDHTSSTFSGRIHDKDTGEELDSLAKLTPTKWRK
ncbi:hypothetical protein K1719_019105 [Acacia pycnantha]|nr:hypothetical protein K1719_019105 [Acacia pycnantha]